MPETYFIAFMVGIVIPVLIGIVSYFARQSFDSVLRRLETMGEQLDKHDERITENEHGVRVHDNLLYGKDDTPWDGFAEEVRTNRNHVSMNRQHIKRHRELLKQQGMFQESDIESVENLEPELD